MRALCAIGALCSLSMGVAVAENCADDLFLPTSPVLLEENVLWRAQSNYVTRTAGMTTDLNGDGVSDFVRGIGSVELLLSDGVGGFTSTSCPIDSPEAAVQDIWLGDFDGDGEDDIVAAYYDSDAGSFGVVVVEFSGGVLSELYFDNDRLVVGAGDFNGDGLVDLFSYDGGVSGVLLNSGAEGFEPAVPQAGVDLGTEHQFVDFDLDGELDIVANIGNQTVPGVGVRQVMQVYEGDGAGGFSFSRLFTMRDEAQNIRYTDLDGDGLIDIVMALRQGVNRVGVMLSASATEFEETVFYHVSMWLGVSFQYEDKFLQLHDLSGDGVLDIVLIGYYNNPVAGPSYTNTSIITLLGNPDGSFGEEVLYYKTFQNFLPPSHGRDDLFPRAPLLIADMNADGRGDLIFNVGLGSTTAIAYVGCRDRRAGDFDDDGVTDATDLATVLAGWGGEGGDLNGDGVTDAADLAILLAGWGSDY